MIHMQPIHPITAKSCRSHCGKPVLIYLNDGSQIFGILSRLDKNNLILNEEARPKLNSAKKSGKSASKTIKTKQSKTASSNPALSEPPGGFSFFGLPLFGPAPGPLGAFVIPLDRVAAIFSE
ncbi:hypothetical protein BC351_28710 [Paenibacillus ferrarius]|uniref:LSM domain-containing protein n=1 Tax=Paenibacillus ferrarius TaxID=1469647 RepID=A0A1V4HHF0_9BACL|nr:hypothetical protein [Paenibacillus ferrarius]OPH56155.1 hypothetical protein BC351_28710 [Paenibacillus ferrarius]